MLPSATQFQARISDIRFKRSLALGQYHARIQGFLKPGFAGSVHTFTLTADYDIGERLWGIDLRGVQWTAPVPRAFFDLRNVESICKGLLTGFRVLWMQPVPGSNEGGAQLRVGQTLMNEEQMREAFCILRCDLLGLYRLDWPRLWPAIENRLANDPEFWVNGYSREDALNAVTLLKSVFTWEWVRRRYRNAAKKPGEVGMWSRMEADQGFPAYHLARTAIGCICKDPGWNFLITLAESCKLLKSFHNGGSLLRRIATEPGHIHQANFSGFLLKRHLLAEVEPETGSGSAKHDMAARVGTVLFDIEMKALTSSNPARQVTKEIVDKCRQLPSTPRRPVVFFVLLVETSIGGDHKSWPDQLNSITPDVFGHTSGVSSVVIGRMFVDSAGGPVKWSFDKFLLNNQARHRVDEQSLRKVFEPNWQKLVYPLIPIVFSFNPPEETGKEVSE